MNELGNAFCPVVYNPDYTQTLASLSQQLSSKSGVHECHTLERHSIYECLLLNVESRVELQLLDRYITQHFEQTRNHDIR